MSNRETLAAADLIPGDVIVAVNGMLRAGDVVDGYPHGGALRMTMLPLDRNGLRLTPLVDSELQVEVIR